MPKKKYRKEESKNMSKERGAHSATARPSEDPRLAGSRANRRKRSGADFAYAKTELKDKDLYPKKELFLFEPRTLFIVIVTSLLTLLIAFFGEQGVKFFASVLSPAAQHAPYDGVTFPVKKVPNWVKLTEAERKASYSAISQDKLIDTPSYNPTRLATPFENLKWNNAGDDAIRNEKITYSVPYLGSYRLDGLEGTGSHPAVDIKIPESTPVYAIGNGVVTKAQTGSGGFGNHIVIQHNNFPSFSDAQKLETIYSTYNHMSSISVNLNDVVTKGQLIGFSGSTGTATTPHLHFQIDTGDALFHPYWPFTSADMTKAGYSFFDAINNALNQNNAKTYTINPMQYVQKYAGQQALIAATETPSVMPPIMTTPDPYDQLSFVIQVNNGAQFQEEQEVKFTVQVFDASGALVSKPTFKDTVALSLLNGNGTLNRSTLSATNLRTGISNLVSVTATKTGKEKLILRFRDREYSSPEFEIVPKVPEAPAVPVAASVQLTLDKTNVLVNESTLIRLKALDSAGQLTTNFIFDEQPVVSLSNAIGTLSATALPKESFSNGEATVTFIPSAVGNTSVILTYWGTITNSETIAVVNLATPPPPPAPPVVAEPPLLPVAVSTKTEETPAPPPSSPEPPPQPEPEPQPQPAPVAPPPPPPSTPNPETSPPAPSAPSASPEPVTSPSASSVPSAAVSVEPSPFSDVLADSKYYPALKYLKSEGLVSGYADGTFGIEKELSRAEAVTFILKAINEPVKEDPVATFPDVLASAWYKKFVETAADEGFVKGYPDGFFRPDNPVNLAEFLTMLFFAANADIDPQISSTLPQGVNATDWFAPFFQEAMKKNIITVENNTVDPAKALTRGEVVEMLYRLKQLEKLY